MVDDRCDNILNFITYTGGGSVTSESGILDGHEDYLKISCLDIHEDQSWAHHNFASVQSSGSVFLSFRYDVALGNTYIINVKNQIFSNSVYLYEYFTTDKLYAYDGAGHYVCDTGINTWYEIEIVFDCTSDQYDVIVDGVNKGTYNFNVVATTLNSMRFICADKDTDYSLFIDGLYFSWDAWAHNFDGVSNASISKINGISKTSISKVNGV